MVPTCRLSMLTGSSEEATAFVMGICRGYFTLNGFPRGLVGQ
jgi:hypothetical protein